MDSDNRREGRPREPGSGRVPARVQPPGPSMEEWQATIERELTGSMPLSKRAAGVRDTDRWWHGPGVYGDYGRRAVSMLRAEYLNDHDLAFDAWGTPALLLDAAGLRVRVRPGTTGIPEHL